MTLKLLKSKELGGKKRVAFLAENSSKGLEIFLILREKNGYSVAPLIYSWIYNKTRKREMLNLKCSQVVQEQWN